MALAWVGPPGDQLQHFNSLHWQHRCPLSCSAISVGLQVRRRKGGKKGGWDTQERELEGHSEEQPEALVAIFERISHSFIGLVTTLGFMCK